MARATGASACLSNETVTLYRAVSPEEFHDIFRMGGFRTIAGSYESKLFAMNRDEVIKLADHFLEMAAVVRVDIPKSLFRLPDLTPLDRHILRVGSATVQPEMLSAFNRAILLLRQAF
jgi:hypothetical protein